MLKQRVIETNTGIQGEVDTKDFDMFARQMRDRGWLETDAVIKSGILSGHVLEIGPGPGYFGLEWLSKTQGSELTGCEISANMIAVAQSNADEYGLRERTEYVHGNAMGMPFADGTFDAVISSGSMHEWEDPVRVFNEAYRVLKSGGRMFVADMKRNTSLLVRLFMKMGAKTPAMKAGMVSSMNAAYTRDELTMLIQKTTFGGGTVRANPFGLNALCRKDNE